MIQVRMLLDEGADKSLVDLQGMTAKDHAKEKECVTIIGEASRGDHIDGIQNRRYASPTVNGFKNKFRSPIW